MWIAKQHDEAKRAIGAKVPTALELLAEALAALS
jgi:hypothetical protein